MIDQRFISVFSSSSSAAASSSSLPRPTLPSLPLTLPEVSGVSDPCYGAPPFLHGAGEKEGGSSPPPLYPQRPIARLLLLLLCTAAAQYQTWTSWAWQLCQGRTTVTKSSSPSPLPLCWVNQRDSGSISSCSASPFPLTRSDYGRGTSGPGMCPVPVAFPAQPGTSSCPGRLPIILQVLLCHATVCGG